MCIYKKIFFAACKEYVYVTISLATAYVSSAVKYLDVHARL